MKRYFRFIPTKPFVGTVTVFKSTKAKDLKKLVLVKKANG